MLLLPICSGVIWKNRLCQKVFPGRLSAGAPEPGQRELFFLLFQPVDQCHPAPLFHLFSGRRNWLLTIPFAMAAKVGG